MSILNAGSASTLDIIAGIKARLPRIEAGLPSGLDLHMVGDQSPFIRAAVSGVVREGAIAAALTGLMILLFLGSWRLTIIVLVTIPLALLFSLTALSWLGETINMMTLGGLALAVGILVDESTVTLENMASGAGQAARTGYPGWRPADRRSGLRHAGLHVHRIRADVPAWRRRRLSVRYSAFCITAIVGRPSGDRVPTRWRNLPREQEN
jgi:Cu/Ag efflux pump CusA